MIVKNSQWRHLDDDIRSFEGYIAGCDAGITQLNMYSNGEITPCALFNKMIVNLANHDIANAQKIYEQSSVIKSLIEKNLKVLVLTVLRLNFVVVDVELYHLV